MRTGVKCGGPKVHGHSAEVLQLGERGKNFPSREERTKLSSSSSFTLSFACTFLDSRLFAGIRRGMKVSWPSLIIFKIVYNWKKLFPVICPRRNIAVIYGEYYRNLAVDDPWFYDWRGNCFTLFWVTMWYFTDISYNCKSGSFWLL